MSLYAPCEAIHLLIHLKTKEIIETITRDFWIQVNPPSRAGTVVSAVETQLGRIARCCRELALGSAEVLGKFELLRYFEQAHIFKWRCEQAQARNLFKY